MKILKKLFFKKFLKRGQGAEPLRSLPPSKLKRFQYVNNSGCRLGNVNTCGAEGFFLVLCAAGTVCGNYRAGMTHALAFRGVLSGDKRNDRLCDVVLYVFSCKLSPIMTIAFVSGSASKSGSRSVKVDPGIMSPPTPTQVD